ncbi:hypothetical protein SEUCBS140593_003623 [Sporothrix eucalyptigena]|uniref:Calcineurin-like phosphoesterase domain-containing protein n=1 Tax=Sporothrix eucalyptigena TaxID=1812306 RepID=A0ABP0BGF2_9PEZI
MSTRRSALTFVLGVVALTATSVLFLSTTTGLDSSAVLKRDYRAVRDPAAPLQFRSDGSFQISIFEDLHFGENAWTYWGPQQDFNSVRVIEAVLDAERPDLVVLNGDLITGENTFRENSTAYLDQIVKPMIQRTVPWASTYGNHDSDFNLSRSALLEREQQQMPAGLARTVNMMANSAGHAGVTNYYLPVYGSNCQVLENIADHCVPLLILWFFDSRGGFHYQQKDAKTGARVGQENWVDVSVVEWFKTTHEALLVKYSTLIPSLAFVHIPPNVAYALQMDNTPGHGIDPHRQPGINDDKPLAQQSQGWCQDGTNSGSGGGDGSGNSGQPKGCAYGGQDEPFMRAIATCGNGTGVIALFSGHDHGDTWCHTWDAGKKLPGVDIPGTGVHFCFGQHSGYGGYGTWTRGARQVRVTEASLKEAAVMPSTIRQRPDVDTWIRLETGTVVGHVSLNATYGLDVYPATPNTHTHCPTCNSAKTANTETSRKQPSSWDMFFGSDSKGQPGSSAQQLPELQVQGPK